MRRTPHVILGDFNEWTRGLTSRLLASHLGAADIRVYLNWRRTCPGLSPVLHLNHAYYDPASNWYPRNFTAALPPSWPRTIFPSSPTFSSTPERQRVITTSSTRSPSCRNCRAVLWSTGEARVIRLTKCYIYS